MFLSSKEKNWTCLSFLVLSTAASLAVYLIPKTTALNQAKDFCLENKEICYDLYTDGGNGSNLLEPYEHMLVLETWSFFSLTASFTPAFLAGVLSCNNPRSEFINILTKSTGPLFFLLFSAVFGYTAAGASSWICNDDPPEAKCISNLPNATLEQREKVVNLMDDLSINYLIVSGITIAACLLPLCILTPLAYPIIKRTPAALSGCRQALINCRSEQARDALINDAQERYDGQGNPSGAPANVRKL